MLAELCCTVAAVGLHVGSAHLDQAGWMKRQSINDVNVGAYVRYTSGLTLGTYKNSFDDQSIYAGWTVSHGPFSATVGGITGYPGRRVNLMLVPSVNVPLSDGWSVRLAYLPRTKQTGAHVVHLMLERVL